MSGLRQEEAGGERNGSLQTAQTVRCGYSALGAPASSGGLAGWRGGGAAPKLAERIRHVVTARSPPAALLGAWSCLRSRLLSPQFPEKPLQILCFLFPPLGTEMFVNRLPKWIRSVASGPGYGAAHPAQPGPSSLQGPERLISSCPGRGWDSRVCTRPCPPSPLSRLTPEPLLCAGAGRVVTAGPEQTCPRSACRLSLKVGKQNKSTYFIKTTQIFFPDPLTCVPR